MADDTECLECGWVMPSSGDLDVDAVGMVGHARREHSGALYRQVVVESVDREAGLITVVATTSGERRTLTLDEWEVHLASRSILKADDTAFLADPGVP